MNRRFVLLDRDGTVIEDKHYLHDPDEVELLPGAVAGLSRMRDLGFGLILVTNQSGVGRGYFTHDQVRAVNERLAGMLAEHGLEFDGIFYCPHEPEKECDCRKPAPGLVIQAAATLQFDPTESYMIGDKACDVGLGRAVGATTILVRTGKGAVEEPACLDAGLVDFVARDLVDAASFIEADQAS